MEPMHLPRIMTAADHETFRRLLNDDISSSYEKWLAVRAKTLAELGAEGVAAEEIPVYPDEFVWHCDRIGTGHTTRTLAAFARYKAVRSGNRRTPNPSSVRASCI